MYVKAGRAEVHSVVSFASAYSDIGLGEGFRVTTYCNQRFNVEEIVVLKPRHDAEFSGWCAECLRLQGLA